MTGSSYETALLVLQKVTSGLSALGSLMIISQVSRSEFNRKKTQQRLMLGISVIDFQTSIVWIFNPFFMSSESGAWWALGDRRTCDAQGFIVQFSSANFLYMCALQWQYLLAIKYGWSEKRIKGLEKWFHLVPLLFGAGTATAALALKQYNPADWDCWIAPLNDDGGSNCTSSYQISKGGTTLTKTDCVRGDNAEWYRWSFFFVPLWASIAFCIVVMTLVYRKVSRTENKTKLWRNRLNDYEPPDTKCTAPRGRFPLTARPKDQTGFTHEVKRQSYRYCCAFLVVWTFPTLARLIQLFGGTTPPILRVLAGTFIGAQGIFNAFIYFRPRYLKCVQYDTWYRKVWVLVHSTLFFCCYEGDYTKDKKDYVDEEGEEIGDDKKEPVPSRTPPKFEEEKQEESQDV